MKDVEIKKAPVPVKPETPEQKKEAAGEESIEQPKPEAEPEKIAVDWSKSYEDMTVEELQEAILEKMRSNGPVTDYMLRTVKENTHHGSLVSWVRSFR